MCEAFARAGNEVTLVHPYRVGNRPEGYDGDLRRFYGISHEFRVVTLPTPLTRRLVEVRSVARLLHAGPLAVYLAWLSRPGGEPFVAYGRSLLGAWLLLRLRRLWGARSACRGVFVEVHDEPRRAKDWALLAESGGVVAISAALRERLIARLPGLETRVWVEHDAVDLDLIEPRWLDREAARRRLGVSPIGPLVVYTGRVNEEKGAGILLHAAKLIGAIQAEVLLVGKVYHPSYEQRAAEAGNVRLVGFVPPARVPEYLAAADILVLPSTGDLSYASYTSPLKLFEYMASGRPIVASDLPVLQEILRHESNALLYDARDPTALAAAIQRLWEDPALRVRLSEQARRDVRYYTWESRAVRVTERITRLANPCASAFGEAT